MKRGGQSKKEKILNGAKLTFRHLLIEFTGLWLFCLLSELVYKFILGEPATFIFSLTFIQADCIIMIVYLVILVLERWCKFKNEKLSEEES